MSDRRIRMNVGGTRFETFESTLLRATTGPLFHLTSKSPFGGRGGPADNDDVIDNKTAKNGTNTGHPEVDDRDDVFFDRDPTHFRILLNYLRIGELVLPESNVAVRELRHEALYFGLDDVLRACDRRLGILSRNNKQPINKQPIPVEEINHDIPDPTNCSVRTLPKDKDSDTVIEINCSRLSATWAGCRDGAPLVWIPLPCSVAVDDNRQEQRQHGWQATVDLKLDAGNHSEVMTLFGIYEGRDGSGNMPFAFGPRTWDGTGIGYQTLHLQDYNGRDGRHAHFVPDSATLAANWYQCRITKPPGDVRYTFSYRECPQGGEASNEGADWHVVARNKIGTCIGQPSSCMARLCIGIKTGHNAQRIPVGLQFRRLRLDLLDTGSKRKFEAANSCCEGR